NWDPKGQTTISDDEVIREERPAKMYTFKYSTDFPFPIATTRPETKLGDTAVAVHPDDKRYQEYVGNKYSFEFAGEPVTVKIVADEHVDPEFGVGALGVTPAHSIADFEIAERHNLPIKQIINEYGKMMVGMEGVKDLKVEQAREKVVDWLRVKGLLIETEDIVQNVGTAERTGAVIEPLPKLQWWIDVNKKIRLPYSNINGVTTGDEVSLKELMLKVVNNGQVNILPDRFEKIYTHWIENLRDWNISRQIWFGHRVPVWYDNNGNVHVPEEKKVHFVRHGQSEDNAARLFGRPDSPLTDVGREQARETGKKIKALGTDIPKIYSSPYPRALETAEIIAPEIGYTDEIEIIEDLQEINQGSMAGTPLLPIKERLPHVLSEKNDGEKHSELIERVERLRDFIKHNVPNDALMVGHTGFLTSFFSIIDGKRSLAELSYADEHHRFDNAQIKSKTFIVEPQGENLTQDEDTLDTWFSSGLWTFSTLGWPNTDANDFNTYHPTDVLETGHDIIFFWVARMILMTTYLIGDVPFKTVYLHGLVRDAQGRKMSKSLGNIVDPVELIEKYGTDALRMALIVGNGPGNDVNLDENKIKAYKKFANKIWNITRFVLSETKGVDMTSRYVSRDEELIVTQRALIDDVTTEMNEFKYYLVLEKLYHYVWHTFADEILEESKDIFTNGSPEDVASRKRFLRASLVTILKVLHPFMPFITEEIWQEVKSENERDILMTSLWPTL
ncbi:class I tRNA ligase family protein, partial [Patescibacteria group bacterium]|nr:class I tRNA ligase family protein [Patescibacteria group bacterium]